MSDASTLSSYIQSTVNNTILEQLTSIDSDTTSLETDKLELICDEAVGRFEMMFDDFDSSLKWHLFIAKCYVMVQLFTDAGRGEEAVSYQVAIQDAIEKLREKKTFTPVVKFYSGSETTLDSDGAFKDDFFDRLTPNQ